MTVHADVIVCCMILTENQLLVYRSRRHRYHSCRRVTSGPAGRCLIIIDVSREVLIFPPPAACTLLSRWRWLKPAKNYW